MKGVRYSDTFSLFNGLTKFLSDFLKKKAINSVPFTNYYSFK